MESGKTRSAELHRFPLIRAFQKFVRLEASGGILLLVCTVIALIWANSAFRDSYDALWHALITVDLGVVEVSNTLLHWINDGLMAIFFFVVGLEIKREVLTGELASPKKAALPIAAALGGMIVPALIYFSLNAGGEAVRGWGIPMATDIAFALGVVTLLGPRVPFALKVFLTALAIIDDLGAVLVIAFFYTAELSWNALGMAVLLLATLIVINRLGVRKTLVYVLLGVLLWLAFLKSGVHATIAGVVLALTIPSNKKIDAERFAHYGRKLIKVFADDIEEGRTELTQKQRDAVHTLEEISEKIQSPLERLEHTLHPWVAFFIMPVFALANAGVAMSSEMLSAAFTSSVTWGILLGLLFGKQIGVFLFSWLAVRFGVAAMPSHVSWWSLYGVAWLTGIGFTMSLFIGSLAFADPVTLDSAKIGILSASILAGLGGWVFLSIKKTAPDTRTKIHR